MTKSAYNISGSWTTTKKFIPMFYQTALKEFIPLVIKRLAYENKNTKT